MLEEINLIENIGKFKRAFMKAPIPCAFMTLIYAENGRGKSTLSSILRSLAENNASIISSKARVNEVGKPAISLRINGAPCEFQNGKWSRRVQNIKVFDDVFINENLYSGPNPGPQQRQNMHKLIVFGKARIELHDKLKECQKQLRGNQQNLRKAKEAVEKIAARMGMEIGYFYDLGRDDKVADKIKSYKRRIESAELRSEIEKAEGFSSLSLPPFGGKKIEETLGKNLKGLQNNSFELVRQHISNLANNGGAWIEEGWKHYKHLSADSENDLCPFCREKVAGLEIISRYEKYFGRDYANLQEEIQSLIRELEISHGVKARMQFQRKYFEAVKTFDYWKHWIDNLDSVNLDEASTLSNWERAYQALLNLLLLKSSSPLEARFVDAPTMQIINKYTKARDKVEHLSNLLAKNNQLIKSFKEGAKIEDLQELRRVLGALEAQRERHEGVGQKACDEYSSALAINNQLKATEEAIKKQLEDNAQEAYSGMETSVNKLLEFYRADFRISQSQSSEGYGGMQADYQIKICDTSIGLKSSKRKPSFETVLSAGDRSTLSLAFFLSHITSQPQEERKKQIVVFDDPMTSMDEWRTDVTIETLCNLSTQVDQVIVLSHSRRFLFDLYHKACSELKDTRREGRGKQSPAYILVRNEEEASEIDIWEIEDESMPDNYANRKLVSSYAANQIPSKYKDVGLALRLIIEHQISAAFAEHQIPGEWESKLAKRMMIDGFLSEASYDEFRKIMDYSNKFHHNDFLRTKNDRVLKDYCTRSLRFVPEKKDPSA